MQEIAAHFSSSHNIHISPDFPSVLIYHFHKFFTVLSNFEGKMDGNFYSETYTYREGRILIYKRPNSKNFQCRLRVKGIKGYTIKSCDTSNLGEAVQFAEDLYDNLRFKKLNNLNAISLKFPEHFGYFWDLSYNKLIEFEWNYALKFVVLMAGDIFKK